MAIKKSQLYASLWQSCDELRGGMDASQYKDYILTLLFMKYVSDKASNDPYSLIEVPEGGSFEDMVKLIGDKEIGDKINKIIGQLAVANDLRGVIDQADFNDDSKLGKGKEMQDRLSKLVAIFNDLDLSANRAEGDDLLGDAYEYLMQHFATESGKSKGQFYTPAEVSRIMAQVIGIGPNTHQHQTIYDPTCGSGSLLLRAADEAPDGITVNGQEKDNATYALARMNMILHGNETAELWHGNTLTDPYFKDTDTQLKTFDFAVANPPFSDKAWTNGLDPENDLYGRFDGYGIPPAKNGDYAFLLHFIASLKSTGKGAIILPHGVLFRGNREEDIRKNLIRHGFIKGIIGLPPNLFYGTGIPACILVIDKESAHARKGIFMIDASKGFLKDGNKNRLRVQDIHKIVSIFNAQEEVPRYSCMVPLAKIAENKYNLNIPRYIDASEPEDLHDLDAHLNGGIPDRDIDALDNYWQVFPTLRDTLFKGNGRPGYSDPLVETPAIKTTILTHGEFTSYQQCVNAVFKEWRELHEPSLFSIDVGTSPRKIVKMLSEDLLIRFKDLPLLDQYDAYQRLIDYWDETMQDDVYLIASDGWVEASKPRGIIEDKQKKIKEIPDLVVKRKKYKMDLIPPALIVARYFKIQQNAIEMLQAKQGTAASALEEYIEEHTGEDGLLADAVNDKGNITASSVKERLKGLTPDLTTLHETQEDNDDERDALEHCQSLLEAKSKAEKAVKDAQLALDAQVLAHYPTLTEAEIKTLVVADKWVASIQSAIENEVQRVIQALTERVKELEERYVQPLPDLSQEVEAFSAKVETHLQKMGVDWE